jgi:hypothetical protein
MLYWLAVDPSYAVRNLDQTDTGGFSTGTKSEIASGQDASE